MSSIMSTSDFDDLTEEEYIKKIAELKEQLLQERKHLEENEDNLRLSLQRDYEDIYWKTREKHEAEFKKHLEEKNKIIDQLIEELNQLRTSDSIISISSTEDNDEIADLTFNTINSKCKILESYEKLYETHQKALEKQSDLQANINRVENEIETVTKACLEEDRNIEKLRKQLNNKRLEIIDLKDRNQTLDSELESSMLYLDEIVKDFEDDDLLDLVE